MKNKKLSLLRSLEYEELSKLKIDGKILDVGGSRKSGYHELIKGKHEIKVVNLDDRYGYDFKFDIEKKFPIKNEQYDAVLCINVLEHIYNFDNVISESNRILKPEGKLIMFTPFLFKVHGCPNDYFRYSKSALEKMLISNKFKVMKIKELGSGFFSFVGQSLAVILPPVITNYFSNLDKMLAAVCKKYKAFAKENPLGYFVYAEKK